MTLPTGSHNLDLRLFKVVGKKSQIYIYIPGTQMTLVLIGKGLVLRGIDLQK